MSLRSKRLGKDARAEEIRALAPEPRAVEDDVRAIVEAVRRDGDAAVRRFTEQFDHAEVAPDELRVPVAEVDEAVALLEPDVLRGLRKAMANVRTVAEAQLRDPVAAPLEDGQHVEIVEAPVRRAAAYVPGGRAPYPSTVVMCAVTARVAGVDEFAVCAPPGPGGQAHPIVLAACALCGVNEVYRMGGAQAIAALAYGTETVPRVDVIVGPGNAYVTEAKRQVAGVVGIDGLAGPSELVVVATEGADPELVALDLLAQSEHGEDSLLVLISPDAAILDRVEEAVDQLATGAAERHRGAVRARAGGRCRRGGAARGRDRPRAPRADRGRCGGARRTRSARAGCLFVGRASAAPRSATTWPARTTCCRPAARRASPAGSRSPPSGAGWPGYRCPTRRLAPWRRTAPRSRGRRASPSTANRWSAAHDPIRRHLAPDERDRHPAPARRSTAAARASATTGVGFFDHMLDALARHGGLDLDVSASGDLETGSHHTVEDVGIVLGQALDEALGDRGGITRYGQAIVPMDEARATRRHRHLGPPVRASSRATCRPGAIEGFDTDLAEEFFRAIAAPRS